MLSSFACQYFRINIQNKKDWNPTWSLPSWVIIRTSESTSRIRRIETCYVLLSGSFDKAFRINIQNKKDWNKLRKTGLDGVHFFRINIQNKKDWNIEVCLMFLAHRASSESTSRIRRIETPGALIAVRGARYFRINIQNKKDWNRLPVTKTTAFQSASESTSRIRRIETPAISISQHLLNRSYGSTIPVERISTVRGVVPGAGACLRHPSHLPWCERMVTFVISLKINAAILVKSL